MRGQQVSLRERIPNKMFVALSTYFYAGTRMLIYSCMDVVYTNKMLFEKEAKTHKFFRIVSFLLELYG